MSEWQDISTAPKDGRVLLLCWPFGEHIGEPLIETGAWLQPEGYVAHWCRHGKWTPGIDPTHWMPLPAPPTDLSSQSI